MGYNLLINGVYWAYNPFTNHLLTSWDILVPPRSNEKNHGCLGFMGECTAGGSGGMVEL